VVADDHAILRTGLRMLINAQPDMEVVGEAEDGIEAVQAVQKVNPDVVILDVTMPRSGGLDDPGSASHDARGACLSEDRFGRRSIRLCVEEECGR
jgi:AmiR/NasT family two-component response regulator